MENTDKIAALNPQQCIRTASVIQPLRLKSDFYHRDYLNVDVEAETRFRMHFFAVAICHQTHTLFHPLLNIYGWDFIENVFAKLATGGDLLINPEFLNSASIEEIASRLAMAFTHSNDPAACSLDRLHERARLMQEASNILISKYSGKVSNIFSQAGEMLIYEKKGLYHLLSQMEAFADPKQKKSSFLIKLLEEDGLVKIKDPENFIPIMDYHMQRVLLRLGCVEIKDADLRKRILNRETLESDEPIRQLCIDAFKIIAEYSGHPLTKMNDFFWSLGRSCCNETTLCTHQVCSKSPCTFTEIVEVSDHSKCEFQDICFGAKNDTYRNLWQPVVETHYY
ncbi:MAG: hypothetical protein K9H16_05265 [Bacteroidales bacterium]|nr:hypothetical protein [Bacteroidales bacterium]